ncbi:MAG: cysteine desulfurase [Rhodocyclaceae bacterium]|jgi:cysteine desulfurase|nr:cysteine desulfurase [Rhodocyclaceae bacterium]
MSMPIYLDYNATTPVVPEVAEAMQPFLHTLFGNLSSSHAFGQAARKAVAAARAEVAALIGARSDDVIFTGSATEANNLALLGVARALPEKRHLVVSAVEHPAVMRPAQHLRESGWTVTVVPVDTTGRVSPRDVAAALRPDTALVSVMHANNEVGTLQPIAEIAALAHANGSLMHTDAAQSAGKVAIDVAALGADLMTLAGHKMYAPKGIGALYVKSGTPLEPVLFGADQEHGLRPGTENVPHIVGFGAAARLARASLPRATVRLAALRDALHEGLRAAVPGLQLNGHPVERLPNTLHVSFPDVTGKELLGAVAETVAASVGSACHADADAVSGVLAAMGVSPQRARGAIRLSVGRYTTENEIEAAVRALSVAWQRVSGRTSRPSS